MSKLPILSNEQIDKKIKRLAYQILENNYNAKKLYLAGINNAGQKFAKLLADQLTQLHSTQIELIQIKLNPAAPLEGTNLSIDVQSLKNQTVIIVDDVANTGRTIFYAFKPIFETLAESVQVAVLVDRKHKSFPIKVDYVGLSLATTLKENIRVKLDKVKEVYLE